MSEAGYFIPLGMIFHRKRMKAELLDGAVGGTMFCCQVKKWGSNFCLITAGAVVVNDHYQKVYLHPIILQLET